MAPAHRRVPGLCRARTAPTAWSSCPGLAFWVSLTTRGANPGPITQNVGLRPALAVRGKLVGPDGKPLMGVVAHGLVQEWAYASEPLKDDTFAVRGFNPRRPRNLVFTHAGRKLGAFVTVA